MKRTILLLLISLQINAQKQPSPAFSAIVDLPEIQKEDVYVGTGTNKEAEENVLWVLKKYWTFGGKINVTDSEKDPFKLNKKISYITIGNYKTEGENGNFYNTQFNVINETGVGNYTNVFRLPFDNMIKADETDKVVGADKNNKLVAYKSLTYTLLFCSLVKHFGTELGSYRKSLNFFDAKCGEFKEKLKSTTILIPQELLNNGITLDAFKGLSSKYKVETSEEIAKRIKDGTDVKNFSHLIVYKADKFNDNAYLVDIETGDLISFSNLGASAFSKTYSYMDNERLAKLLAKL